MKKFIIIGNLNSVVCKEIFPIIKNNEIWMGVTSFNGGAAYFYADGNYFDPKMMSNSKNAYWDENGKFVWRVNGVRWYTNVPHSKRNTPIDLYKKYSNEYPKYDNYDAINVDKVVDIPYDYNGIMGVPVSFIDKYCPEQFEILWQGSGNTKKCCPKDVLEILGYKQGFNDRGGACLLNSKIMYTRIFIRKRTA